MKAKAPAFTALFLLIVFAGNAAAFHDEIGKTRCLDCHTVLPFKHIPHTFQTGTGDVCRRCHTNFHAKNGIAHPVEALPSMKIPPDMPLDIEGRMTCITCHFYHPASPPPADGPRAFILRRPGGRTFCYSCHKKF